jgi:hypothetical protein
VVEMEMLYKPFLGVKKRGERKERACGKLIESLLIQRMSL